ncbi:MAG: hypothetical protein KR126chlam2_00106 [Chlamydiae bacterium]|nr:hypothetical protein [Chlamydiota bacterium]
MKGVKSPDIIFYDGECPLCNRAVRFVLQADHKALFKFAPLGGETAAAKLKNLEVKKSTLVLLQSNGKILTEGKAVLRMMWLLGGFYSFFGWLSFQPSLPFDLAYRFIAKRRYTYFHTCQKLDHKDRFLP